MKTITTLRARERKSGRKDAGKLFDPLRARPGGTDMEAAGESQFVRHNLPRLRLFLPVVVPVHRRVDYQRSFHGCDRGDHLEGEGIGCSPAG